MKIQDEKALMDAVMEKAAEFTAEPAPEFDEAAWSFKKFERMGMEGYDSNMPLQQGTFRRFLDFLSGMMKQSHGCTNYHDLGTSDEPAEDVINRMEPILKKYFDTEVFVIRRTDGTVVEYGMLYGEGEYGDGKQQVVEADLVNLGGGLALSLDNAMNDDSENGVKNQVIKAYVDRLILRQGNRVRVLETCHVMNHANEQLIEDDLRPQLFTLMQEIRQGNTPELIILKNGDDFCTCNYTSRISESPDGFSWIDIHTSEMSMDNTNNNKYLISSSIFASAENGEIIEVQFKHHTYDVLAATDISEIPDKNPGDAKWKKQPLSAHAGWILDQNKVTKVPNKDLMPLAQEPNNTSGHFLNALGEYRKVTANDFTDELKEKLDGIEPGANVNTQADYAETDITSDRFIKNKPDLSVYQTKSGDSKDNTVDFAEMSKDENIISGDSHASLFGKIKGWFSALRALAFKDKVDWETDVANKPVIINKIKAGRELVNPAPDNVIHFQANEVIFPLKCDPTIKTKGVGNIVIYGYQDERTGTTEIRVKCAEHLLQQLIKLGALLNIQYKFTNSADVEETGTTVVFFTSASIISLKKDGYWTCKKLNNSRSLIIESYEEVVPLNAPDYNTPISILINTDVLPTDVAPIYSPDKLEFLHSEESGYKHLPAGGKIGQVLTNIENGNGTWQDAAIVIPVDFTKSAEDRKTEVLTFVQPFFDDGRIFTKPVYAQFTFTSALNLITTVLIKANINLPDPIYSHLIFDEGIATNKNGSPDPGYTLKLTKNNIDNTISYTENEVFKKTPEIIVEYAMQSKGTSEGYRCVFATGNCKKLDDAIYALEHDKPFALFYQPKGKGTQVIPGYLVKYAGVVDMAKVIYESGCQWDEVKKDGTIIHHDYKVVTDEVTPTSSLVKSGAMGLCYKTKTEVLHPQSLYTECIQVGDSYLEAGSGHEILFKENEVISPSITLPQISQKGSGNVIFYSYYNAVTEVVEIRTACTLDLVNALLGTIIKLTYTIISNNDVATIKIEEFMFSVAVASGISTRGFYTFKSINNSKSLTIDSYSVENFEENAKYKTLNVHINITTLPVDVLPTYLPGFVEFKHTDIAGFKHIPIGGTVGQVLINTADGAAEWQTLPLPDLSGKVDKVEGKQLSTEDYTTEEKQKLASLSSGGGSVEATNQVTLVCTVPKIPSALNPQSPIQKEALSCSDTESLIKISNYIKTQTPFSLFLKIVPLAEGEVSLLMEGSVTLTPNSATITTIFEMPYGEGFEQKGVIQTDILFASSENENGAAEILGIMYAYFRDLQTPNYVPTISTGVSPVSGSDSLMLNFENASEKDKLVKYVTNDYLITGGKSPIYIKADIGGQITTAKLFPAVVSGLTNGIETVQIIYSHRTGALEYGSTSHLIMSVFVEFEHVVETGAITQKMLKGQVVPAFSLNIVVTDTLAASYPDGTIVIKTA